MGLPPFALAYKKSEQNYASYEAFIAEKLLFNTADWLFLLRIVHQIIQICSFTLGPPNVNATCIFGTGAGNYVGSHHCLVFHFQLSERNIASIIVSGRDILIAASVEDGVGRHLDIVGQRDVDFTCRRAGGRQRKTKQ